MSVPDPAAQPADDNYRQQQLALAVQREVAKGGRVESQTPYNAIIRRGKDTNHVLHLILTLITLGFWLLIWVPLVILHKIGQGATILSVDQFGNVNKQKA